MNLRDLLTRLQAEHHHDPQGFATVTLAINEIERHVNLLNRLGHVFHLEYGPAYDIPEWPKILFHVHAAPNGRIVNSQWEAIELGPGWWPTYDEAQYKEGVRSQFRGRGGIVDRTLPMLMDGPPMPRFDPTLPTSNTAGNKEIIDEWKRTIRSDEPGTTDGPVGADTSQQPSEVAAGESFRGEPSTGADRVNGSGTEPGIPVYAGEDASRISEDAVQVGRLDNSE